MKKKLGVSLMCLAGVLSVGSGELLAREVSKSGAGSTLIGTEILEEGTVNNGKEKLTEVSVKINGKECDFYSTSFGRVFGNSAILNDVRNVGSEGRSYLGSDVVGADFWGYLGGGTQAYLMYINNISDNDVPISECSIQNIAFGVGCPFNVEISGGISIGMSYEDVVAVLEPESVSEADEYFEKFIIIPLKTGHGRNIVVFFDSTDHVSSMSIG